MGGTARRRQPSISIRSERASDLLRMLVKPGHSQAEIIERALEQMAAERRSLAAALTPRAALNFEWDPPRAGPGFRPEGHSG